MGINYDEGERANEERARGTGVRRERGEQSAVGIGEGKRVGRGNTLYPQDQQ